MSCINIHFYVINIIACDATVNIALNNLKNYKNVVIILEALLAKQSFFRRFKNYVSFAGANQLQAKKLCGVYVPRVSFCQPHIFTN
jgi:hypothetical protein